jgi:hypothetical protein
MARSYIAASTGQPIDDIAVRIVRSRWWRSAKRQIQQHNWQSKDIKTGSKNTLNDVFT